MPRKDKGILCPPFLFNIEADTLAKMLNNAQTDNWPRKDGVAILQYADGTILCIERTSH